MAGRVQLIYFHLLAIAFLAAGPAAFGQVYSYVDGNGVRVLTNIAPQGSVSDLKVSGTLPAPAAAKTGNSTKPQSPVRAAAKRPSGAAMQFRDPGDSAPADYDPFIEKYSDEYGVDPDLIRSMIMTESGFNAGAVSPKGAQGLMQLMPATASRLGVKDPFNPEENISGGIRHMRSLLDMFSGQPNSLHLSLAAYNAGENLVQRLGRIPAIAETNDYVRSIIQRYGKTETIVRAPQVELPPARVYYYIENGVPVLTNIPPVMKTEANGGAPGPKLSYR